MNLPPTVRPSLVRIITLRLAIASVLAMLLQVSIVIARAYLDEDDLNRSYVTREARTLMRGIQAGTQGAPLKFSMPPRHYLGQHASSYAFRILTEAGTVVAEHNGAMLAQLSPWLERPSRPQDFWLVDLDANEKLYVAGGLRQRVRDQEVWVEVATWADPDRVYLGIVAAVALDDAWMPIIPLLMLTLGVAVFSVRPSTSSWIAWVASSSRSACSSRARPTN
jgi:hypothetical protein